ncbi:hypothetical protein [Kutzneria buriramensis]|uniref:hypothetical protein n=1 Tax=Kutzneria buriramensis TaxID=1045776 RepID=UPI000E25C72F|nr:hypothetical protein [Kutzneria buriramensis]
MGTTTATRQIPVSELLARHRGEQRVSQPQWDAPTACETTDVIPVVQDEYYLDEPYAATGYSEAYEYVEERADDVRPFVAGVSPDTDRFPLPVLDNPHAPEEQTLYAPIDVEAMDAEAGYTEIRRGADPQPETALIDAETVETPSCDDTPSREIYIRELLRREGRLPREQRRKQAPKIAAAAAGVAALCGAVAASIVHVQNADTQSSNAGGGVPLTVVDGGGPHGQALDAPLAPRGTEAVTQDNSAGGAAATTTTKPRVAPYVQANQKAQQQSGGTSTTPPTTTTDTPPPSSSDTPPASSTAPSSTPPSSGVNNNNSTPPSTPTNGGHSSNNSTPPPSTSNNGLLDGIVGTVSGLLG